MARHCQLTGRRPRFGHHVSHANNKRKRVFRPNLQRRKFFVPSLHADVTLVLSTRALRTVNKRGIDAVVHEILARGEPLQLRPRA